MPNKPTLFMTDFNLIRVNNRYDTAYLYLHSPDVIHVAFCVSRYINKTLNFERMGYIGSIGITTPDFSGKLLIARSNKYPKNIEAENGYFYFTISQIRLSTNLKTAIFTRIHDYITELEHKYGPAQRALKLQEVTPDGRQNIMGNRS